MRSAPLILLFILCVCDFGNTGTGLTRTIRSGKDRLTLKYVSTGPVPGAPAGTIGSDFHSLVWESEEGDFWRERAVITKQQFEAGTNRERWVSALDSFDPKTGNAVIKVAESNVPTNIQGVVSIIYSWRKWNLLTNAEVQFIRVCRDPFEKY
jgi:hypothetical protein